MVVSPSCLDAVAGLPIAGEAPLVQALIAQPADEALDEAVLHGLARCDGVPLDLPLLLPCQDGVGGQFRCPRRSCRESRAVLGDGLEFTCHPLARERVVCDAGRAFPAEVAAYAWEPEAASLAQRVGDDVRRASLVGVLRDGHRCPGAQRSLSPRQALLLGEAVELLAVHPRASREGAPGGSRSAGALPPDRAASGAGRRRPIGSNRSGRPYVGDVSAAGSAPRANEQVAN